MNLNKLIIPAVAACTLLAAGCDIDKTQDGELPDIDVTADAGNLPEYEIRKTEEGRLPDVDVDARGGELPEYDIDGPEVTVGEKRVDMEVPDVDVDVDTETKSFEVPTIDVDLPDDDRD